MQQIIRELVEKAGLTEEQALKSIHVIKGFIQTKVPPGFSAMIDNFFASATQAADEVDPLDNTGTGSGTAAGAAAASQPAQAEPLEAANDPEAATEDAMDKMKEFAKQTNNSLNEWLKDAEEKGEDMLGKIKGMFGTKDEEKPKG